MNCINGRPDKFLFGFVTTGACLTDSRIFPDTVPMTQSFHVYFVFIASSSNWSDSHGIEQLQHPSQRRGVSCKTPANVENTPSRMLFCSRFAPVSLIPPKSYEFASMSAHFDRISWFFAFAASRFALVRSSLWARRHLLTSVFAPLHMPIAFHMNPLAWHSSRRFMTSSQARLSFVCK